ncbi:MAG TPA: macro domain-containing protein [Sphaerochaeta sp.]|nr:macro domain-containing protein [Sphaerochaeta sp.]
MPFLLFQGDITLLKVDAVVNAANRNLKMGGGVCGAIFKGAGVASMQQACVGLSPVETGDVAITDAFSLPSKHVIHAVGPIWEGGEKQEEQLLISCYQKALALAQVKGLQSIAFPLIASGIYGYPKEKAYRIAVSTILSFLEEHDLTVYLVLFEEEFFKDVQLPMHDLGQFVQSNLSDTADTEELLFSMDVCRSCVAEQLDDIITELEPSFSQSLMRLIREKGLDEVEVYKRANIDRKHFSKIRSNDGYQPTKRTVIAFAISLRLTAQQTRDLLLTSGFSLSHSYVFDIIIEYFIENRLYDIHTINEALFTYEQPLLGA